METTCEMGSFLGQLEKGGGRAQRGVIKPAEKSRWGFTSSLAKINKPAVKMTKRNADQTQRLKKPKKKKPMKTKKKKKILLPIEN